MKLEINMNQHTAMMPVYLYFGLREKVEICRSIAHKHKDLHAQTSHQAQTSHHWRGISFH